ncbi:MAG: hypothetical protein R3D44_17820 [Hyphomicrobiaceae bacterium]
MRSAGITSGPHVTPKGLRHGFGLQAILFAHNNLLAAARRE